MWQRPARFAPAAPVLLALVATSLCATTLLSCDQASKDATAPAIRLADERHRSSETSTVANVPSAAVGGVRRPILAPWRPSLLARSLVNTKEGPRIAIDAPIREGFRADPMRIDAAVTFLDVPIPEAVRDVVAAGGRVLGDEPDTRAEVAPAVLAKPGTREHFVVTLPAAKREGDLFVEVFARAGETEWTSAPLEIPPRAVLRFGVAIDPADEAPVAAPATAAAGEGAHSREDVSASIRVIDGDRSDQIVTLRLDPRVPAPDRRWSDREVDLAAYAGRTVKLRFASAMGNDAGGGEGTPVVLWSDPVISSRPPRGDAERQRRDDRRRNLILISLDTLRADHVGSYGYGRETSPVIDALLAARGALFEHAYTPFPHTVGSHMTMLTSVDPCVHGLRSTAWANAVPLREDLLTLAEVLRDAGYDTAGFTEDAWVTAALGYDRGFGTFVEDSGSGLNQGNVETTFRRALDWIEQPHAAPFFVFVHTYQVHDPYTPPPGYMQRVAPQHGDDRAAVEAAGYDAEIRYTDDVVGRFLSALDQRGLSGRTLVALTADHGQHFGEHGVFGHSTTLFEDVLHVPLVLRGPGVPNGKRIGDTVGLIDLMPTLLELIGVDAPPALQGTSLVPTLRDDRLPARTLYAELSERGLVAARRGSLKLLLNEKTGHHTAFDVIRDPGEEQDVSAAIAGQVWSDTMAAYRRHCARGAAAAPGAPYPLGPAAGGDMRKKLKALGYTE